MKTIFQTPEDYLKDFDAYKKGCKAALIYKHSKGEIVKSYPRTIGLFNIDKESCKFWDTYIGEIDLVHKFRNIKHTGV